MYKKMYLLLFRAITDVLKLLETGNVWEAKKLLIQAQQDAEEIYISWEDGEGDNPEE